MPLQVALPARLVHGPILAVNTKLMIELRTPLTMQPRIPVIKSQKLQGKKIKIC
jgi:hypothetical protein